MKQVTLSLISIFLLCSKVYSQDEAIFHELIDSIDKHYESEKYQEASEKYMLLADLKLPPYYRDWTRFNAACAHSLAGNHDQAFEELNYLAHIRTENVASVLDPEEISSEEALSPLKSDIRWTEVTKYFNIQFEHFKAGLDSTLIKNIEEMNETDQVERMKYYSIVKKYGRNSEEEKSCIERMRINDSINVAKAIKIIDKNGWPDIDKVGLDGNWLFFLLIQHADDDVQEKYLPLIQASVKQNKTIIGLLALIEDRVSLNQTGKQLYGTQWSVNKETDEYELSPILNPDEINKRRFSQGLCSMEKQMSKSGKVWKPEDHK